MNTNLTQYQVIENGKEACSGNLRQCWLYVLNTHAAETTAASLSEKGVFIQPKQGEEP
jgi:hypothetical protein